MMIINDYDTVCNEQQIKGPLFEMIFLTSQDVRVGFLRRHPPPFNLVTRLVKNADRVYLREPGCMIELIGVDGEKVVTGTELHGEVR